MPFRLHAAGVSATKPPSPRARIVYAATLVALTYLFFLIFAQFALLKLSASAGAARPVMTALGLAGIAASVVAAWRNKGGPALAAITGGFALCASGATVALAGRTTGLLAAAGALTGAGLGFVTVNLAATLRGIAGQENLGRAIGWGTGLAYAMANTPALFLARPEAQTGIALLVAAGGVLTLFGTKLGSVPCSTEPPAKSPGGAACWVAVWLGLVAFDSGVFYHIQHTPLLKASAWGEPGQLWLNAAAHLAAAVLAGTALDRGRLPQVALAAAAGLGAATGLIFAGQGGLGAPLYAAAVSAYSTGLVFYPARSGDARLAAWVYAVAGWGGSALGLALAGAA